MPRTKRITHAEAEANLKAHQAKKGATASKPKKAPAKPPAPADPPVDWRDDLTRVERPVTNHKPIRIRKPKPIGPILDVTRHDAVVRITRKSNGDVRDFEIKTQSFYDRFAPGKRYVALTNSGATYPVGFAWATPNGLTLWPRLIGKPKWELYVDMLESPSKYIKLGFEYEVTITQEIK